MMIDDIPREANLGQGSVTTTESRVILGVQLQLQDVKVGFLPLHILVASVETDVRIKEAKLSVIH